MIQLSLDLGIKTARPIINANYKWDVSSPSIKMLVNKYILWVDGEYINHLPNRHLYEQDIISCFEEINLDGYNLAKHLEERAGVDANSDLVYLLDRVDCIKRVIKDKIIKSWVIENNMKLPENIKGRKCKYKLGFTSGMEGFITLLRPENYEVCVDKDNNRNGGYIVGFEDVTLID